MQDWCDWIKAGDARWERWRVLARQGWAGEIGRAVEDNPAIPLEMVKRKEKEQCFGRI